MPLSAPIQKHFATPGPPKSTAAAPLSFRNRFAWSVRAAHRHISRAAMRTSVRTPVPARPIRFIGNFQLLRRPPQPLQVVIVPSLLAEHMHDKTSEIQQRPFRRAASLAVLRGTPLLLVELFLDLGANCLHLRRAESGANHEVRRKRAHSAEIQHRNPRRFFVLRRLNCETYALWQ